MLPANLVSNTATAWIIAKYLQDFCQKVGVDHYLTSAIRYQHGNGTGGFRFLGMGNPQKRLSASGNNDCVKERFRGITDGLKLTYRSIDKIQFRSASCVNLRERCKTLHRVEHTVELIDIYHDFENQYIITTQNFTANDLAKFVLQQTLVCLIEQKEQKPAGTYNLDMPFSKYSAKVFYQGQDVSGYTRTELFAITAREYGDLFKALHTYDFTEVINNKKSKLIDSGLNHSLPALDMAVKYHNNPLALLKYYYHHQRKQLTESDYKPRYYNHDLAQHYAKWAQNQCHTA